MLDANPHARRFADDHAPGARPDAADVQRILRREWPLVVGVAGVFVLVALIYVLTARPLFSAASSLMIDTRKNQLLQGQQVVGEPQVDSGMVESQVEILRSEGTALSVIRELKLTEEAAFVGPGGSLLGALAATLSGLAGEPLSRSQLERRAVATVLANLSVRRVGLTYVLEIGYASPDPWMAARVANAVADAYMVGELDAKYQATKRAGAWLQDRIQELRAQAQAAEQAVQTFKAANNIVGTNRGLMGDQQLGDVNAQLVTARAATAEAKARLDRIAEIARGDLPNATVTDALHNDVITRLRAQYLDLGGREADWSQRYGQQHAAVQNLRNQMREIRASILEELKRIAETYKSDHEIAQAREQSVQASLTKLVGQAATTGQAQVTLRDLESSSQTARNLYDTFLQRSMEATQQQTFPVTDARIITVATAPTRRSSPKVGLTLAGAAVAGLFAGVAAALAHGRMDRSFRTLTEVEDATGHPALGILPLVAPRPAGAHPADPADADRQAATDAALARHAVENPFSRGAETLRSVKVAIDGRGPRGAMTVIGITSSLPREGKTTVAANLAQMVAQSGRRTILIDGDLRNPSVTRTLTPTARAGLIEVLTRRVDEREVTWTDSATGLSILPAHLSARTAHTAELIASAAMADLLARLKERYDYVFVDLPPVLPVVDVRAAAHLIDGFVFVVEWGRTDRDAVMEAIRSSEPMRERTVGFVLNTASPGALNRIEAYKGRSYRHYYG